MVLFEQKANEEEVYYVWKGKRAGQNQRPMHNYYYHCGMVGELKSKKDSLADIRLRAARKFFMKKDDTHANIYRHYLEVERW